MPRVGSRIPQEFVESHRLATPKELDKLVTKYGKLYPVKVLNVGRSPVRARRGEGTTDWSKQQSIGSTQARVVRLSAKAARSASKK